MRLLIATHGTLAEGFKSAISIIIGKVDKIDTLTGYVNDVDLQYEMNHYFEKNADEEIVVATDLFGGSVNQAIMGKLKQKDFFIITGVNLPLLLEITLSINQDDCNLDKIRNLIEHSKEQVMFVNDIFDLESKDDFD